MKLNPQQAPLYGDCLLTVQLADEEMSEEQEENGVEFYLLFSGSSQRHLTTTQRVSHATLQAVCPAHNVCESVQVTLCSARPRGPVGPLSEESFHYVQDLALDLARFLLSAAGAPDGPEGALLQDECQVGLKECERLDRSLTLALGHHTLPPGWSVLGAPARPDREEEAADLENGTDVTPRDTLLHFAARRGLRQVAVFLLRQPGGREALRVPNRQGSTPGCLARAKGHLHLLELLQQAESSPDALGRREQQQLLPGGRALQHHPALGTYTLTVASGGQAEEERRAGAAERRGHIQGEVEELRRLIQQHREHKESQAYRDGLSQTHVHSQPSSNHGVEAWTCSNGEPRSQDGARLSGPALGDCGKPRDTLGSSWSAVVGQEEEEPASVTVSSCQAGSDPHQVDKEEIKPVGPCQSLSTATTETIKTTCSAVPITSSGTTLPRNVGVSVQKHKRKAGKSRAAVIAADRKQEEVLALNSCKTDRQAEETKTPSERLPERQRRKAETSPERAPQRTQETEVTLDPTAAMGQTQARDHDQDTGEQTPTDAGTNSPSLERNSSPNPATDAHREGKRRRVLWRDGGWHESNAPRREASPSSTIWYDEAASDTQLASETSRLSLGSSDASPGPPLLLCGATDPSPALAVALGAGSPPALSHGAAQRQEAHAPPQEEGQWEEVAEREGRERADSGEREESEDRGERGGKGKRRKRRKKGKRAGAESKPSSSFDTDTQADLEVQTEDRAESQGESGRSRTSLRSDSSTESETRTSLPASVMRLAPCMAEDETGASGPGVTPEPGQANSRAPGSSDTVGATETAGHGESREATEPVGDFTFEESLESSKLKESEESIAPVELTECIDQSVSASECKELVNEARDKRTDVSARQKKEGTAEVGEKYFEQCLSIESEGGGKDNLELKTTDWRSEEGRTEERRLEDTRKEERSYKEELAATAVAVVTVAIAGAIATIELKELLCSKLLNQSDSTHKAECSITVPPGLESKAPAQSVSQLAAQAVNQLPTQPVSQLATQSVSQLAAQAVNQLPTQPVSQLATLSVSQLAAQAVNQLPTQPVNQLPTQPVSHVEAQYVNQLPGQAVSQLPAQSVSQLPAQSVSKLAALSVSQLPAQSVSKLAALPLTQLAAQSVCPPPAQSDSVATAQATTKLLEQSDSISPTQSVGELTDHPDSLPITQSAIQPPPQSNSIFTAHSDSIPIAQSSSIPTAQSGSSPAKRSDCLPTVITASQAPAEPDRVVFGQSARQPVAQPRGPFTHQSDSPPPAPSAATEGSAATGGGLPADRDPEARPEKPLGHLDGVRGAEQPQDEEGLHWTAGQTTAPQGPLPQAASLPAGAGQGITGGNMEAPPGEHQPGSKPGSAAHAQEAASVGQATVNSPTDTGTDTGTYQEGAIDHPGLITLSAGPSACEIARNHDNGATHLSLGLSLPTHTEMEGGTVQHPDRTSPLDVTSGWSGALPPSHAVERAGGETERRTLGAGGSPRDSGGREPPASLTPGEPLPQIHKDKDTVGPLPACPGPGLDPAPQPQLKGSRTLAPCPDIVEECVSLCGSEVDGLVSPELGDDCVFKKASESVSGVSDSTSGAYASCSSMDDTSSLGPLSTSSPSSQGACWSATSEASGTSSSGNPWTTEQTGEGGAGGGEGVGAGGEEEERKDKLTENPVLRSSIRSLSPLRRHSWGPGKIPAGETDLSQRSSLKSATAEVKRVKAPCHRRSMSWSTSNLPPPDQQSVDNRSYSLEGLSAEGADGRAPCPSLGASDGAERCTGRGVRLDSEERGSLVSLTEEEQEGELGGAGSVDSQQQQLIRVLASRHSCPSIPPPAALTKSVSMVTISQRELDVIGRPRPKRRISFSLSISPLIPKSRTFFSIGSHSSDDEEGVRVGSFSSTSGSVDYSISEEEQPGPLRSDSEGRGGTKVSRTFSYLKSKMSKKTKEKDKDKEKSREKEREKDRESREKERKPVNGHVFNPVSPVMAALCPACSRPLSPKDAFLCNNCGAHVHKSCRESVPVCAKVKMKPMTVVDGGLGSSSNTRSKCLPPPSALPSTGRERPWSVMVTPEEQGAVVVPRRKPSLHLYHSNLAKSMSISNIAGPLADDGPATLKKYLSQSTDSLNQNPKVNASTESLTDEGTDMMDSQLMGEFEGEVRQLEADSWSFAMDKKFVKLQKKEVVKRQDVIYELYQTEMHHVRTLRIMSEVYSKGLQKELQLDPATLEKVFPVLEELLALHSLFLSSLLERKRASLVEGREDGSFLIRRLGDVLVAQFSGSHAEQMKKVYGKFCSRHSDAVNLYKELHAKDKRFQAFTKRKMSSSIVRRLSIPECILLVTQRITKYPVLLQRILQHTKETDEDHGAVAEALRCVKLLIAAVDSKVNEQEKKRRLREVHRRTDSKSITRMKSGQMFAREDLVRGGRKLLHDGALQLKNATGRLKDVQAMLLSDVFVFLQEKDQKYSFASLDQRSTVLSLQKLIVREVANEERGLFLITAGTDRPEMVEVLASSKEERNTWMSIIQDAMHSMEKEEDEGVPSETEEDRRQQESRAREIREFLRKKDDEIVSLLEDKVHIFRELCTSSPSDSSSPPIRERMLFRATPDDVTKGEPIMKDALKEVESLHVLVNGGLGAGACSNQEQPLGGGVGPVCLPRRAETFGGFDSHQMNNCKNGEKEEGDESVDLRRTESDGVLKKGAPASLQLLLKRNNEQVVHSVLHLHELLTALQAVVLQQDSFIEEQRQALSERPASRHSSSSSLSSATSSSRPNSLIEQEKQRSAERQRQEAASLHKQQAAHAEERRRREREWEAKEESLAQREERVRADEEEERRRRRDMEEEREELLAKKEEYQRDLERLRETQRRLERDREVLRKETERMEAMRRAEPEQLQRYQRTPSTTSEDSLRFHDSGSLDEEPKEPPEVILSSSAPTKEPFLRIGSKRMGKNFNPFSSSSSSSKPTGGEGPSQMPSRLMQLAKPKEKKDKKKKKGKGEHLSQPDPQGSAPHTDGDIFFC